jgi:solute carrier family 25 (mitochondrial phosphate transporter), member 23/24/25/41
LRRQFDALDARAEGSLTVELIWRELRKDLELRRDLEAAKGRDTAGARPRVTEQELEEARRRLQGLVQRIDKDNNGTIEFEEWCEFQVLLPGAHLADLYLLWQKELAIDTTGIADTGSAIVTSPAGGTGVRNVKYLVSGGIAGAISRSATAPLDRIKILLQTSPERGGTIASRARQIYENGGIKAFWRGNGANVLKIIPESSVRFVTYEACKRLIHGEDSEPSARAKFLAGGLAGITSQMTIYPLELVSFLSICSLTPLCDTPPLAH